MGKNYWKPRNIFLVWQKGLWSNYTTVSVDWIDFDLLATCSLSCTCGSHVFLVYLTHWEVDPCRVQKGENRNDMHVFNTVMCLLFNGTENNSYLLLLKIDFLLLMWNCPFIDASCTHSFTQFTIDIKLHIS